jgi:hypothetical protein
MPDTISRYPSQTQSAHACNAAVTHAHATSCCTVVGTSVALHETHVPRKSAANHPHCQRCMQTNTRVPQHSRAQHSTAQHSMGASPHPKHWLLGVYAACTDNSSAPSGLMPACTAGCNMELHGLICSSSSSMCHSSKQTWTAAVRWRYGMRVHTPALTSTVSSTPVTATVARQRCTCCVVRSVSTSDAGRAL